MVVAGDSAGSSGALVVISRGELVVVVEVVDEVVVCLGSSLPGTVGLSVDTDEAVVVVEVVVEAVCSPLVFSSEYSR